MKRWIPISAYSLNPKEMVHPVNSDIQTRMTCNSKPVTLIGKKMRYERIIALTRAAFIKKKYSKNSNIMKC